MTRFVLLTRLEDRWAVHSSASELDDALAHLYALRRAARVDPQPPPWLAFALVVDIAEGPPVAPGLVELLDLAPVGEWFVRCPAWHGEGPGRQRCGFPALDSGAGYMHGDEHETARWCWGAREVSEERARLRGEVL